MAELLTAHGWPVPGSVGAILSEGLPDSYFVVENPTVQGRELDTVLFGPQGLFILHVRDWAGEIEPNRHGDWRGRIPSGQQVSYPDPAGAVQQAESALRKFLQDEFPKLQPAIRQMLVLTDPDATVVGEAPPDLPTVTAAGMVRAIEAAPIPTKGDLPDETLRESLAVALRDRRLTISQRAAEPFVFRAGGTFGSGKKVWTVRQAVSHMDHHPQDGIYHLQNDTLARWLEEQGAPHLAVLARESLVGRESDPRVPVEKFLIGTGLVKRPMLEVRPQPVNLGCAVSGETSSAKIQVRKGRGRGYLFGRISSRQPWLKVEPHEFSGRPLDAIVTADASVLAIQQDPWQAELLVESNASEEPVRVPVRLRVTGVPAPLDRRVLRPLTGFLVAGVAGAIIGWVLGGWAGAEAPGTLSPPLFWALAIGIGWALFGAIRGARQRAAWPVRYATGRFLLSLAIWTGGLLLGAAAGLWIWGRLSGQPAPGLISAGGLRVVLIVLALAVVPAVLGETRAAGLPRDTPIGVNRRSLLRPLAWVGIGLAALAIVSAGVRTAGPVWREMNASGTVEAVQDRASGLWKAAERVLYTAVDQYYLERYDRRAPSQVTPTLESPSNP
jgi:Nuclease-related domain